jgi:putative flippase GtrA
MKYINREFNRFLIVGAINTLTGYILYVSLLAITSYTLSYTISYILGIFISYYLNSRFVFRTELKLTKAVQYPLVYLAQYVLGIILLRVFVELLGVSQILSPALIILITVPVTYLLNKLILKGRDGS